MKNYHSNKYIHIKNITLVVKDIERMLQFYQDVLGMSLLKKVQDTYYLGIEEELFIKLIHNSNARSKEKTTGLYHFAILLPSRKYLGQILHHFITNEVSLGGFSDHGVSEAIYLIDPEENGIEIYSDKEDNLWPRENEGITMYTDIMDINDVLDQREKSPFKELPKGSKMGHIHLHVSDLIKAEDFFASKLGFQKVIDYGRSALFLSDGGYHHHIGLNTWSGINIPDKPEGMIGLSSYIINLPNEKLSILDRLDNLIKLEENKYKTKDINNCDVIIEIANKK